MVWPHFAAKRSLMTALDALLKDVQILADNLNSPRGFHEGALEYQYRMSDSEMALEEVAPRLAAMLRIAVEALKAMEDPEKCYPAHWRHAIATIEDMASKKQ